MSNPMMPVPVGRCYAIYAGTVRAAASTGNTRYRNGFRQVLLACCFGQRNLWLNCNQVFLTREAARHATFAVEDDTRRAS